MIFHGVAIVHTIYFTHFFSKAVLIVYLLQYYDYLDDCDHIIIITYYNLEHDFLSNKVISALFSQLV